MRLKFLKKGRKKFEQLAVLFTGFFGLQIGIFGKFYWFFDICESETMFWYMTTGDTHFEKSSTTSMIAIKFPF